MANNNTYPSWFVKYDAETMPQKAIELFKKGKSITGVASNLGVTRETYYTWIETHKEFAEACKIGLQASQEFYEDLSLSGVKGEMEKFSASMCIFIMKNRFRDSYSDQAPKDIRDTLIEKLLDKKD